MNMARFRFGICSLDNYLYVFGGYREVNAIFRECEAYNFEKKVWEQVGELERPRSNIIAYYVRELDLIALVGGRELLNPSGLI